MSRANDKSRPVMLTAAAARRVGRAVAAFERGDRDQNAIGFRNAGGDDEPLRLCKTTAAWNMGTVATLEVWEDGTPPNEAKTTGLTIAGVVNKLYPVDSGVFVVIAQVANGYWYLVAAVSKKADIPDGPGGSCRSPNIAGHDLTTVPGYTAAAKQALTHDNGCFKWVDVEECPTGSGGSSGGGGG